VPGVVRGLVREHCDCGVLEPTLSGIWYNPRLPKEYWLVPNEGTISGPESPAEIATLEPPTEIAPEPPALEPPVATTPAEITPEPPVEITPAEITPVEITPEPPVEITPEPPTEIESL
jgi:hypothetical protein